MLRVHCLLRSIEYSVALRVFPRNFNSLQHLRLENFRPLSLLTVSPQLQLFNLVARVQTMQTEITHDMVLDYEDIKKLTPSKRIVLIDVREPQELTESGAIPGSTNIPLNDLKTALRTLSDSQFQEKYGIPRPGLNSPVVFHCRSGKRSYTALQTALELGFTNAKHYGGGFVDWEKNTSSSK